MRDFVNWCNQKNLIDVFEDGTVTWRESKEGKEGKKCGSHKEKFNGGRDGRKDLSGDYKDYCHNMGTVWPFKVQGKGGKPEAPVKK